MRLSNTARQERQFLDDGLKQIHQELEQRVFEFDLKGRLKRILEESMLTEFEEHLVCVPAHVRSEQRKNLRNGFYRRSLQTVFGMIEDLKVPRPRNGGFTPSVFEKYERRETKINKLIVECYWRGISSRDMTFVVNQLSGVHISGAVVSRLVKKWDGEAQAWHLRPLGDDYAYLMFDGVWIKNRSMGGKRRLVLVAYGIRTNGKREIIDYQLSQSEKEENWLKFLTQLTARGLTGKNLKLIVSDGCKGLHNAVAIAFPMATHQLCWAHKVRNILKNVKKADQIEVKKGLRPLFTDKVTTKAEANGVLWAWRKQWRAQYPDAVRCLERDLEMLLHYLSLPKHHQKALRTSNHIERQFKEFRRRLRSMEMLPNKDSAERALYALTQIRNEKLGAYPLAFTQRYLH